MFWEILGSGIVFAILTIGVAMLGMLLFCVGYLPAIGVIMGAGMNMLAQWYEVFLSRGGEPIPPATPSEPIVDATIV